MTNPACNTTSAPLALTFDVGLSVVKATVFKPDGCVVPLHDARNDAVTHHGCNSEMNLPRLWALVLEGAAAVLAQGVHATAITGIGLSAAGNGLYLVTPDGEDLMGITSIDGRAQRIVNAWQQSPFASQTLKVTGNHIWAGQPLPLLAHLKEQNALPDDFRMLFCKDWLRLRLTGKYITDRSDASAAGLLDVQTGQWANEILQAAHVGDLTSRLPDLADSTTVTGVITDAVAMQTGLHAGTPVFGGGIDLALGAWADGLSAPDTLHVTAGTWSINQLPCTAVTPADMPHFLHAIIPPSGCNKTLVDSSPTSAINIDMLCAMTGTTKPDFGQWETWLRDTHLDCDDPIYLPYPAGTWDMPDQRGAFCALRSGLKPEQIVAAVYDGIALGHVRQIRKFQDRSALRKLMVCGGMTRSDAWCQRLSDYTNLPLEIPNNLHSSSWGAGMCAFAGLGVEVRQNQKQRRCYQPQPNQVSTVRYQRFCERLGSP